MSKIVFLLFSKLYLYLYHKYGLKPYLYLNYKCGLKTSQNILFLISFKINSCIINEVKINNHIYILDIALNHIYIFDINFG